MRVLLVAGIEGDCFGTKVDCKSIVRGVVACESIIIAGRVNVDSILDIRVLRCSL